jgi:uncharacterized protein YjiS (DUF1127 family)
MLVPAAKAVRPAPAAGPGLAARLLATIFEWSARARERRALFRLDDHLLKDIGLSRADVAREADKHFWQ